MLGPSNQAAGQKMEKALKQPADDSEQADKKACQSSWQGTEQLISFHVAPRCLVVLGYH